MPCFVCSEEPLNLATIQFVEPETSLAMSRFLLFADSEAEQLFVTHRNNKHRSIFIGGYFAAVFALLVGFVEIGFNNHWEAQYDVFSALVGLIVVTVVAITFRSGTNRSPASRAAIHEYALVFVLLLAQINVAATSGILGPLCSERVRDAGGDRNEIVAQCHIRLNPYLLIVPALYLAARLPRVVLLIPVATGSVIVYAISITRRDENGTGEQNAVKVTFIALMLLGLYLLSALSEYLERRAFIKMVQLQQQIRITQERQQTLEFVVTSMMPREALLQQRDQLRTTDRLTGAIVVAEFVRTDATPEEFDEFVSQSEQAVLEHGMRRVRTFQHEFWAVAEGVERINGALAFAQSLRKRYGSAVRIAIHYGDVVSVSTSLNYDIQGDGVKLALAAKYAAKEGEVLLTTELITALSDSTQVATTEKEGTSYRLLSDGSDVADEGLQQRNAQRLPSNTLRRGLMHLLSMVEERDAANVFMQSINSIDEWLGTVEQAMSSSETTQQRRSTTATSSSGSGSNRGNSLTNPLSAGGSIIVPVEPKSRGMHDDAMSTASHGSTLTNNLSAGMTSEADDNMILLHRLERRVERLDSIRGCTGCGWTWGRPSYAEQTMDERFVEYLKERLRPIAFIGRAILAVYMLVSIMTMAIEDCWSSEFRLPAIIAVVLSLSPLLSSFCIKSNGVQRVADVLGLAAISLIHALHQGRTERCVALGSTTMMWFLITLIFVAIFNSISFVLITAMTVVIYIFYLFVTILTADVWLTTPIAMAVVTLCLWLWHGSLTESVADEFDAQYQASKILSFVRRENVRLERILSLTVPSWATPQLVEGLQGGSLLGAPLVQQYPVGVVVAIRVGNPGSPFAALAARKEESQPETQRREEDAALSQQLAVDNLAEGITGGVYAAARLQIVSRQGDRLVVAGPLPDSREAASAMASLLADTGSSSTVTVHTGALSILVLRSERLIVASDGPTARIAVEALEAAPPGVCYLSKEATESFKSAKLEQNVETSSSDGKSTFGGGLPIAGGASGYSPSLAGRSADTNSEGSSSSPFTVSAVSFHPWN